MKNAGKKPYQRLGKLLVFAAPWTCMTLLLSSLPLIEGLCGASNLCSTAEARTPRQTVSDSLRSLQRHSDDLVKAVQVYLQSTGRWAPMPQGKDMQLCQALQSFQKQVKQSVNDNGSRPYNVIQSDLIQVQLQSQNIEQLINQVAPGSTVSAVFMQVKGDLISLNSSMSAPAYSATNFYDSEGGGIGSGGFVPGIGGAGFVPGIGGGVVPGAVPGTVVNGVVVPGTTVPGYAVPGYAVPGTVVPGTIPGTFVPGTPYGYPATNINIIDSSPFAQRGGFPGATTPFAGTTNNNQINQAVYSNLSNAENQTDRFVKQLQSFLQMRANWPPAQGTPQMLLCENLQSFQQGLRKFRSDMQGNVAYPILQSELQQLAVYSQQIDQLLLQTGATPDVTGRWNEIRTSMTSMYQSFYATSTGHYWMR